MLRLQPTHRRCGEMADATDLKSVPAKAGYGFESHHRQPRKRPFFPRKTAFFFSAFLFPVLSDSPGKMDRITATKRKPKMTLAALRRRAT